jgi:hypothetical protein
VSVLGSHSVGKLVGDCLSVIVRSGLLSLGAVWSDWTLLDNEVGAAVQTVDKFHNNIVVGINEEPGTGDGALSVTDDVVGNLMLVGGKDRRISGGTWIWKNSA